MSNLWFEWDGRKSAANAKKHGVSFDEAKSVFVDERAKLIDDPDHSDDEDRFVLLGLSGALRLQRKILMQPSLRSKLPFALMRNQ